MLDVLFTGRKQTQIAMRRATPSLAVLMHVTEPSLAMLIELAWLVAVVKEAHVRIQVVFYMISSKLVSSIL